MAAQSDQVRIHPGVDVGVRADVVALVVHRPARIAAVHPGRVRRQVPAGAGLVAERPDDHARVVLVALDGPRDPVQIDLCVPRVVARVTDPALELEAVGLQIALVDHPEAELVQQRQHLAGAADSDWSGPRSRCAASSRAGRSRACCGVEHPAPDRMSLVPVHPAERHRRAVHQELRVDDLHGPEADPQADRLARCSRRWPRTAAATPRSTAPPRRRPTSRPRPGPSRVVSKPSSGIGDGDRPGGVARRHLRPDRFRSRRRSRSPARRRRSPRPVGPAA